MDRINELLENLTTLSDEELGELRSLISDEFSRLDGEATTVDNVALMNKLADAGDQVMAESANREAAQQQAEADKESARQRIAVLNGETEEEPEAELEVPEAKEGDDEDESKEPEAESEETVEEPEAVLATGAVVRMARGQGKAAPSPEASVAATGTALVAAAGYQAGRPVVDKRDLGQMLGEVAWQQVSGNLLNQRVIVASANFEYPEDRVLGPDAKLNTERMDEITGLNAPRYDRQTGALVASGGICQPGTVDYSIPTLASAERPLKEALPSFEATRGAIRYIKPGDLAEWESATSIWTEATDAEPAGATKPVKVMVCGEEVEVFVEAVPTRLGFGNMQSRFAPEQVAADTDLAIAAAARVAENNLLKLISEVAVADQTSGSLLGATRDLITVIDQTVAAYRWIHRLPDSQALTAIFPTWLRAIIKTDIALEIGHSQNDQWNALMISDENVDALITAHGVNPIWHMDGQGAKGSEWPLQGFASPTAKGAVAKYPTKLLWYFFAEGQIQFLDGGRLDLGVVRDSTLDATNDYEIFVETFEGIADRGFTNGVLQLSTELCANGGTAGTIATAGDCA
jgi:hypothetical protein